MKDTHSLSHTKWNCKYHIVFVPKYRRKAFYESRGMHRSCAYVCGDTTKNKCIKFMGFLKGKSGLMIYERWRDLKYKYRNRQFWCRGYYVYTVGKNTANEPAFDGSQFTFFQQ